jgi:hypothetical protein
VELGANAARGAVPLNDVLGVIAIHDAPRAWQWAQKTDRASPDRGDFGELFEQWGRQDGAEAFRVAQTLPGSRARRLLESVVKGWTISNPHAALVAVQGIKDRGARRQGLDQLFQTWAEHDPHAAMDALLMLPSRGTSVVSFDDGLNSLTRRDPQALPALIDRLAPGTAQNHVLEISAGQLASADPAAAFAIVPALQTTRNATMYCSGWCNAPGHRTSPSCANLRRSCRAGWISHRQRLQRGTKRNR